MILTFCLELAQLSESFALNVLVIPFSDSLKITHETTDKEEGKIIILVGILEINHRTFFLSQKYICVQHTILKQQ